MNKMICRILLIISVITMTSCSIWSTRDWDGLKNRTFYLNGITYGNRGSNKEEAMDFMKDLPVDIIMECLAKRYNIEIDSSYYNKFIENNNHKKISTRGGFQDEFFSWKGPFKSGNMVQLEYNKKNNGSGIYSYTLSLQTDGKNRAVFVGNADSVETMIKEIFLKTDCSSTSVTLAKIKSVVHKPVRSNSRTRTISFPSQKNYDKAIKLLKENFTIIEDTEQAKPASE